MSAKRQKLIDQVARLPDDLLDEAAESLEAIVSFHNGVPYRASAEELAALDAAEASGVASADEVTTAFAKFGRP